MDEYDDIVADSLNHHDDQTNLLFKNIIKREGGFKSFGARDSVLSGGGGAGRNSYTSRFSSKYGDNRLYLRRLSRNSLDTSTGFGGAGDTSNSGQYKMKIRPKPRKYNKEDMDESYFANSNEDGNQSREDDEADPDHATDKSDFFKTSKREFKIFDKKIAEKRYASNRIRSYRYSLWNFMPLNLVDQFQKNSNLYFLVIMILQMIPLISITDGQPTILLGLIPVILVSMMLDFIQDRAKAQRDSIENNLKT